MNSFRSDTHMKSILRGCVGGVIGHKGWGVSKCSGSPIFMFFIKENWICPMIRQHANNILLARNLPFDSDLRQ